MIITPLIMNSAPYSNHISVSVANPREHIIIGENQGFSADEGFIRGKYFHSEYLFLLFFSLS